MGHPRNQLVMWIALAVAIAIPFYMWRRTRSVFRGLQEFVAAQQLTPRSNSPVAAFSAPNPPEGMHFSSAYDGPLRPGTAMTLMLLRRTEAVMVRGVSVQNATLYVGVYLPPTVALDAGWLKGWQDKAPRKQGYVVYAARAAEGGVVIVWQGTPSRQNIEARLSELTRSLPGA